MTFCNLNVKKHILKTSSVYFDTTLQSNGKEINFKKSFVYFNVTKHIFLIKDIYIILINLRRNDSL